MYCTVLAWRLYCLFIGRVKHVVQQNEAAQARIFRRSGSVLHMQKQSDSAPRSTPGQIGLIMFGVNSICLSLLSGNLISDSPS